MSKVVLTVFCLCLSAISLLVVFGFGVSQIGDSESTEFDGFCTDMFANYRPMGISTVSDASAYCGWSNVSGAIRESVTFLAFVANGWFIYCIVKEKTGWLYVGVIWMAGQVVAMLIIMGLDSNNVRNSYDYCTSMSESLKGKPACSFMKYILTCIMDALAVIFSAIGLYCIYKYVSLWKGDKSYKETADSGTNESKSSSMWGAKKEIVEETEVVTSFWPSSSKAKQSSDFENTSAESSTSLYGYGGKVATESKTNSNSLYGYGGDIVETSTEKKSVYGNESAYSGDNSLPVKKKETSAYGVAY